MDLTFHTLSSVWSYQDLRSDLSESNDLINRRRLRTGPQGLRKYIPQRIHLYTSQKRTSESQRAQPAYDIAHELQRGCVDLAVGSESSKISRPKWKELYRTCTTGWVCNFRHFGDHYVVIAPLLWMYLCDTFRPGRTQWCQ